MKATVCEALSLSPVAEIVAALLQAANTTLDRGPTLQVCRRRILRAENPALFPMNLQHQLRVLLVQKTNRGALGFWWHAASGLVESWRFLNESATAAATFPKASFTDVGRRVCRETNITKAGLAQCRKRDTDRVPNNPAQCLAPALALFPFNLAHNVRPSGSFSSNHFCRFGRLKTFNSWPDKPTTGARIAMKYGSRPCPSKLKRIICSFIASRKGLPLECF